MPSSAVSAVISLPFACPLSSSFPGVRIPKSGRDAVHQFFVEIRGHDQKSADRWCPNVVIHAFVDACGDLRRNVSRNDVVDFLDIFLGEGVQFHAPGRCELHHRRHGPACCVEIRIELSIGETFRALRVVQFGLFHVVTGDAPCFEASGARPPGCRSLPARCQPACWRDHRDH